MFGSINLNAMLLSLVVTAAALFVIHVLVFPKTKGVLRPLKIPTEKK